MFRSPQLMLHELDRRLLESLGRVLFATNSGETAQEKAIHPTTRKQQVSSALRFLS